MQLVTGRYHSNHNGPTAIIYFPQNTKKNTRHKCNVYETVLLIWRLFWHEQERKGQQLISKWNSTDLRKFNIWGVDMSLNCFSSLISWKKSKVKFHWLTKYYTTIINNNQWPNSFHFSKIERRLIQKQVHKTDITLLQMKDFWKLCL